MDCFERKNVPLSSLLDMKVIYALVHDPAQVKRSGVFLGIRQLSHVCRGHVDLEKARLASLPSNAIQAVLVEIQRILGTAFTQHSYCELSTLVFHFIRDSKIETDLKSLLASSLRNRLIRHLEAISFSHSV